MDLIVDREVQPDPLMSDACMHRDVAQWLRLQACYNDMNDIIRC